MLRAEFERGACFSGTVIPLTTCTKCYLFQAKRLLRRLEESPDDWIQAEKGDSLVRTDGLPPWDSFLRHVTDVKARGHGSVSALKRVNALPKPVWLSE